MAKTFNCMRKKNFAPTIYPINRDMQKDWFVKYIDQHGKLCKRYGSINQYQTLQERLTAAKKLIKEITNPVYENPKPRESLIRKLNVVLDEKRYSLGLKTYQTYTYYLKKFAVWYRLEQQKTKEVNPYFFALHLQQKKYSPNLVKKMACILGSFFNVLVKRKQYKNNPFSEVKIKKIKGKSKLPFHDEQIKELLPIVSNLDAQLRDAIDFLYYLYFRPKEIHLLKIEHILFYEMKITATAEIIKDKDNYLKAIPLQMQAHILKYKGLNPNLYIFGKGGKPALKPLSTNALTTRMTKILRSLNYGSRFSLYSWVHTGIKKAAMSGIPIKQLQLQKGHSDLKIFDEYLKDLGVNDCLQLINNFPSI
jgi:integrase